MVWTIDELHAIERGELVRNEIRMDVYGRRCAVGRASNGDWYYRPIGEWGSRFLYASHATEDVLRRYCAGPKAA